MPATEPVGPQIEAWYEARCNSRQSGLVYAFLKCDHYHRADLSDANLHVACGQQHVSPVLIGAARSMLQLFASPRALQVLVQRSHVDSNFKIKFQDAL